MTDQFAEAAGRRSHVARVPPPEPPAGMRYDVRDLAELDRLIHEPGRLMIVAVLSAVECADFVILQRET